MKHPVVFAGSIIFCLVLIGVVLIGMIALNGTKMEESRLE